ncbi:hypothetical protein [Streptomyces flavidovirens]|uniref:hypothetical protein n=1 Tax=Streptomyces flavidovirens TaxID=67298 RepID=UPI00041EB1B4|nr:hypothetical protein [Streptomyces flavidovirens]
MAIIVAALTVRTAAAELREPGSARREWAFATNASALTAGLTAAILFGATGWQSRHAALAWSMLAGVLVAYIVDRPGVERRGDDLTTSRAPGSIYRCPVRVRAEVRRRRARTEVRGRTLRASPSRK